MLQQADLKRAELLAGDQGPYCFGDQFLFQIVGGRLYVQFQTTNRKQEGVHTREGAGWFPGSAGPGEQSAFHRTTKRRTGACGPVQRQPANCSVAMAKGCAAAAR